MVSRALKEVEVASVQAAFNSCGVSLLPMNVNMLNDKLRMIVKAQTQTGMQVSDIPGMFGMNAFCRRRSVWTTTMKMMATTTS